MAHELYPDARKMINDIDSYNSRNSYKIPTLMDRTALLDFQPNDPRYEDAMTRLRIAHDPIRINQEMRRTDAITDSLREKPITHIPKQERFKSLI